MSNFRIKQIHPGKKSRKSGVKRLTSKVKRWIPGFLQGLFVGLVLMAFAVTNITSTHTETERKMLFTVESFSKRGEVYAQEPEETVIEGVEKDKKAYAKRMLAESTAFYFGSKHVEPMLNLVQSESGFDPEALNKRSGACGLGQALPCAKMQCEKDDVPCQVSWVIGYVSERYGNPTNAWRFWQSKQKINGKDVGNWY